MTGRTLSNLTTLRGLAPQRLVPEHAVGDPQDAIDLGERLRLARELHHPVVRLGVLLDLVRELIATPWIEGVPRPAAAQNDLAHASDDLLLTLLFGGKDDWQVLAKLVLLAHVPLVVIEGLMLGVLVRYLERVKPEMLRGV